MSDPVIRCSACGAPIGKRDCRCTGDRKFAVGWTTEEISVVTARDVEKAQEVKPEPIMKGDQCVLI